jgi:hypothetical protein
MILSIMKDQTLALLYFFTDAKAICVNTFDKWVKESVIFSKLFLKVGVLSEQKFDSNKFS